MKKLFGVATAMITPFDNAGKVDAAALREFVDFQLEHGVHCLYPCGTAGEMLLCSVEERKLIAETIIDQVGRRIPVFVHIGAQSQADTITLAKHAEEIGADGIGAVTPMYYKLSDQELISFYEEVCGSVAEDFPVYSYAIPQYAANDLSVEVVAEIANRCPNMIGVKYSYPDMPKILDFLTIRDDNFSVMSGADHLLVSSLAMACDGVVSGCASAYPDFSVAIYDAWQDGQVELARQLQVIANRAFKLLGYGTNIALLKALLNARGVPAGAMRAPLLAVEPELFKKLKQQVDQIAADFQQAVADGKAS